MNFLGSTVDYFLLARVIDDAFNNNIFFVFSPFKNEKFEPLGIFIVASKRKKGIDKIKWDCCFHVTFLNGWITEYRDYVVYLEKDVVREGRIHAGFFFYYFLFIPPFSMIRSREKLRVRYLQLVVRCVQTLSIFINTHTRTSGK